MSGKNFVTVCKWICGGWAFCSCTLLMGQVVARPLPGSKVVGRPVNGAIHHKINPPSGTPAGAGHAPRIRMDQAYGKLPLSFEPNQGQANSQVQFLSRGEGYTLFLTGDAAVLALQKPGVRSQESGVRSQESVARHPRESGDPERRVDSRLRGNDRAISLAARHLPDATDNGPRTTDAALTIKMVGANPTAKVLGLDELRGRTNYFIGKDPKKWRTNVPNYAKVKYQGVYPDVDLVYYGNQRHLEFDFILAPGADLNVITLAMEGGDRKLENGNSKLETRIAASGDLIIKTEGREVRFHKPVVYQEESSVVSGQLSVERSFAEFTLERSEGLRMTSNGGLLTTDNEPLTANHKSQITNRKFLDGRYILTADNQLGFEVAAYDHTKPLVIDPVLSYSTYLGGSNFDYAYGIAIDPSGNAYVTGQTDSIDFPTAGQVQGSGGGTCTDDLLFPYVCFDAFVAKLNPAGTALIYSTYLGGSGADYGTGIAVDSSGNAYVTGYTLSTDFPTLNPFQPVNAGGNCGTALAPLPCYDSFVTKLNAAGSALVYSTYLGGTGFDLASGISVDSSGAAYVVGSTSSTNFPVTRQPLQAVYGGGLYNGFVTKLNPAGSTVAYSTYLGGSKEDHGAAIVVDSIGEAFVTGYTNSSNFPTMNPLQGTSGGGACGLGPCFDAFIAKLNATGSALVYSTYFGGSGGDYGYGIAVDSADDAYVTGLTTSTNLPVTPGAYQSTGGGSNYDAYIMKMNPAGSALIYSTYLGGIGNEVGNGIAVDFSGNAYVTGYTHGVAFPIASPLQSINNGFTDAFVAKMNAAGSALIFSTYIGGSGNDIGQGIAADTSGNVFVVGGTFSTDFPVTAGALKTTYGGGAYNAFVAKISDLILPVSSLSQTSIVFPGQGVSTTSSPITVKLTNSGDATLLLSSITATGDFAVTNDCGSSVLPGVGCTLSITSTPTVFGPRFGTVTVTDSAWGSPHVISLTGNGIPSSIVTLSPSSLTFGQQLVGTTSPAQTVTLANTGDATLNIASIAASGSFSQTNNCPAVIIAGGSCVLQVTFSPTSRGTTVSQVTISDDAPGNPQAVILTGVGTGPAINLSSTTLFFGNQFVSTTSTAQTVILTSSGEIALTISSIVASGDYAQTNNCVSPVAPGASCAINVTFTPAVTGTRTGAVTITDNATSSPQSVSLSGTGTAPAVSLSNVSLTFAGQNVMTTSPAQIITLTNSGTAVLTITGVGTSGDYADADTCGTTVAPGASCTLPVTFTPTATGMRPGGLILADDAPGSPQTIALSGMGTSPIVTLSPASLIFAGQLLATSSAVQVVQLTNSGTGPLTITSIAASGDYAQINNCVSPVAAGTSCAISVTFTPTVTGTRTGAVTITDDAAGSPQSVSLSGTGTSPSVTLSATSLTFANQGLTTSSAAQVVHLTNSGTGALAISSIVASGDFAQTNTCAGSVVAGGACDISIVFTPLASGAKTGAITISDNAGGSPQTVALTGTGVVAFSLGSSQSAATIIAGTDSTPFPISVSSQFGFTGAVSLSCTASAPATCSVNPAAAEPGQTAVLTVNNLTAFTGNSLTITVTGTSGSQSALMSLTLLVSDFTLASSPTSTSIASGQAAKYTMSLAPENSFNHVVSLSCSGAPQAASCSILPNSLTMDGSNTLTAAVTVTTTARSNVGGRWNGRQDQPAIKIRPGQWVWWLAFITILVLVSFAIRKNGLRLAPCGAALFLALLCGNCGGGGSGGGGGGGGTSGTPAGVYTLTITATSGGLSHVITVNLTVF